jgi:hypothetical protein
MFSFPASLVFGIIGIFYDNNKWLAIISTLLAGGIIFLYMSRMGMLG